jgi:hypothetical protein
VHNRPRIFPRCCDLLFFVVFFFKQKNNKFLFVPLWAVLRVPRLLDRRPGLQGARAAAGSGLRSETRACDGAQTNRCLNEATIYLAAAAAPCCCRSLRQAEERRDETRQSSSCALLPWNTHSQHPLVKGTKTNKSTFLLSLFLLLLSFQSHHPRNRTLLPNETVCQSTTKTTIAQSPAEQHRSRQGSFALPKLHS